MKKIKPDNPKYYFKKQPLGLFVLLNSCKEQGLIHYDDELSKASLWVICDWEYVLMSSHILKKSLMKSERWDLAYNTTAFLLFLRIYYDSLANIVYLFLKLQYPKNSRLWLQGTSFNNLLKTVNKLSHDSELAGLKFGLDKYQFEKTFKEIKNLRDRLKNPSTRENSHRLIYMTSSDFPLTGELKKEIGIYIYKTISFTDFIGDYLLAIAKNKPIERMESTHHGYSVGILTDAELKLYRWFLSS